MKDVAVTGVGMISPLGSSVSKSLEGLWENKIGIAPAPWYTEGGTVPFAWWAVVPDFVPSDWMDSKIEAGTDSFAQFALAAAVQAVESSGISDLDPERTAVVMGTSMGGIRSIMKAQYQVDTEGPLDRKTMIQIYPNMAASQIAMRWGLHGQQLTVCTACASSLDAIGTARRLILSGEADVAIVGGVEGALALADGAADGDFVPATYLAQSSYGMSSATRDPARASLPFDEDRSGIATGEGAAVVILESVEHARGRNAKVRARIAGYGSVADGFHPSTPNPTGQWEARAMQKALDDAGVSAEDVDVLVAHATATPKGDLAEISAINSIFGHRERQLKVSSLKGHLGHTGASSGAMGVIASIHAMDTGTFFNTAGTTTLDPNIRFEAVINRPVDVNVSIAQVNAFGFGGQNASVVVRRAEEA